jgi:hypothetical protein
MILMTSLPGTAGKINYFCKNFELASFLKIKLINCENNLILAVLKNQLELEGMLQWLKIRIFTFNPVNYRHKQLYLDFLKLFYIF